MRVVVATALCRRDHGIQTRAPRHSEAATTIVTCLWSLRLNQWLLARLLFLVEKSDSARIEAVVATDYLDLSGINFGFENRRR
jgi:hypothetical protein